MSGIPRGQSGGAGMRLKSWRQWSQVPWRQSAHDHRQPCLQRLPPPAELRQFRRFGRIAAGPSETACQTAKHSGTLSNKMESERRFFKRSADRFVTVRWRRLNHKSKGAAWEDAMLDTPSQSAEDVR